MEACRGLVAHFCMVVLDPVLNTSTAVNQQISTYMVLEV